MPKRARSSSKTARRPKRRGMRRTGIVRRSKRNLNFRGKHNFTRYTAAVQYQCALANEHDVGMHFAFDQMINYGEFTVLFDRYCINRVTLTFQLVNNPDAGTAMNLTTPLNSLNYYPKIWYVYDSDDANPLTLSQIKERESVKCRILRPNAVVKINVRPAVLLQTYRTALTTGYAPKWGQYIDCGQPEVPHYGLKFVIDMIGNVPAANFYVRQEAKYHFTLKDVR